MADTRAQGLLAATSLADCTLHSNSHFNRAIYFALQDLEKAAVLIFANKQDMENKMGAAEIARELNLIGLKDINVTWHIQTCCALTGDGLFDVCLLAPAHVFSRILYCLLR